MQFTPTRSTRTNGKIKGWEKGIEPERNRERKRDGTVLDSTYAVLILHPPSPTSPPGVVADTGAKLPGHGGEGTCSVCLRACVWVWVTVCWEMKMQSQDIP